MSLSLNPDTRARTAHQLLHLNALIKDLTAEGAPRAKIVAVERMRDNIDAWPDDRLAPADIHDWIKDETDPTTGDRLKQTIEAELPKTPRDQSQK